MDSTLKLGQEQCTEFLKLENISRENQSRPHNRTQTSTYRPMEPELHIIHRVSKKTTMM